ncbi:hypothetical protein KY366_05965 [Candidatus Woesearchaeota archaeon]|nr:hypothetical protein [Candidatus Woesearchaeota archaeon]
MKKEDKGCCPKFSPNNWDKKTFKWKNKPFIKDSMPTLFHIPFPPMIGKKITSMYKLAKGAKADPPKKEWLVLFHDPHPFKSELYMSVKKPIKEANNAAISGTFFSRVFDGPYNAVPKFIREMNDSLSKKGKKADKYYVHYAYCPVCSKKFGHNYMVLFAGV